MKTDEDVTKHAHAKGWNAKQIASYVRSHRKMRKDKTKPKPKR